MILFKEIKKGTTILLEGEPYEVIDRSFRAKQQRSAMATVIMKSLLNQKVYTKNFQSSDQVEEITLEESKAQFLYKDGNGYNFMDQETYDQFALSGEQLGDAVNYLKEEIVAKIKKFNGKPIDIVLPAEVSLKVIDAPPGLKGDTAQGSGTKIVTLETGMQINVPLFIKEGDNLLIKTKTGNFDRREN